MRLPRPRLLRSAFRSRPLLSAVVGVLVVGIVPLGLIAARPSITINGVDGHELVGKKEAAALSARVTVDGGDPGSIRISVDGQRRKPGRSGTESDRTSLVELRRLPDGEHRLSVRAHSLFGLARVTATRDFTVDTKAPALHVPTRSWTSSFNEPATVEGAAAGAVELTADGEPVPLSDDDEFQVRIEHPPGTIRLAATDAAGNTAHKSVAVAVKHPDMRGVHVSAVAWASDALREPILDMARKGAIDTVVLDIKNGSGVVAHKTGVKLAREIGAAKPYYNARRVVKKLHDMGVRLVGRVVCFRDPLLAQAAWDSGHHERVVQTPDEEPYPDNYGKYAFTNVADETVAQYNIDLAVEAAKIGFDDILLDFVRRPEGDRDDMVFPGMDGSPSESVARFTERAAKAIHDAGAFVGVTVSGDAAAQAESAGPESTAQKVPAIAANVDYLAPKLYPSHREDGEYGVAEPNSHPGDAVQAALERFQQAVEGTSAVIVPWLQDFSYGVKYGEDEVRAQIEAALDSGADSFFLWNTHAQYTWPALPSE